MQFNLQKSIQILERTPTVIEKLLDGIDNDWINNNEGPDTWSPYDIVGHLIHGEKTDWIPRMELILSDNPDKHFISFDRFAQFRESKGKTIKQLLSEFSDLRKEGIQQLKAANLTEALLDKKGIHPEFGEVSLRKLLAAWVVHDLGHIHQMARVMAKQYNEEVGLWTKYLTVLHPDL